jgi:hypothetical protein
MIPEKGWSSDDLMDGDGVGGVLAGSMLVVVVVMQGR